MKSIRTFQTAIRLSFFIVYFWFGLLKVLELSPASLLVTDLLHVIVPSFPPDLFLFYFGLFEMIIGISFLFPKITKLATFVAIVHLITTFLPLILLPNHTWVSFGVLTQEGQYIMKNLFIIAGLIGLNTQQATTK